MGGGGTNIQSVAIGDKNQCVKKHVLIIYYFFPDNVFIFRLFLMSLSIQFFSSYSNLVRLLFYLGVSVSYMIRTPAGKTVNRLTKQLTWMDLTHVKIN